MKEKKKSRSGLGTGAKKKTDKKKNIEKRKDRTHKAKNPIKNMRAGVTQAV